MRLIFMGTPDFAVAALRALVDAGHEIAAVYAQPPRPAGRGQHRQPSPVQRAAESLGITVRVPISLRGHTEQTAFAALQADCAIVAAYGLILPQAVLDAPRLGCINIHASLLPRWRGAAPIQRAIGAGDRQTGITLMRMDAGLDTGPMLRRECLDIGSQETAGGLHDRLAALGAAMIVPGLADYAAGRITPETQPEDNVTYAAKLRKEEGAIDWRIPAPVLDRQIRALTPWPGCFFRHGPEVIKLLAAEPVTAHGTPGCLLDAAGIVACSEGALRIQIAQRPGKSPVRGVDLINGLRLKIGDCLGVG